MSLEVKHRQYDLSVDEKVVWLQANREFGVMVPGFAPSWRENREKALNNIRRFTAAQQIVRMKPLGVSGFVDLDKNPPDSDTLCTDGFITTNANLILHANPADCGEIAVNSFAEKTGKEVIGLIHASRRIVGEDGHLRALEYMADTYGVEPEEMKVRLSPSARVLAYAFPDISEEQKTSPLWQEYIYRDKQGLWHIDFHGRTVDDLVYFGIKPANITESTIDTIADQRFASHYREAKSGEAASANGLFFALR